MTEDSDNLAIWDKVKITNPVFVKGFDTGKFSGHAIDPIHLYQQATSLFGPCGVGWGVDIVDEQIVDTGEAGKVHMVRISLWYHWPHHSHKGATNKAMVPGYGATRMAYMTRAGKWTCDEDAAKKSLTDAIGKALSLLGFAADVRLGKFEDSAYVQMASRKFGKQAQDGGPEDAPPPNKPGKLDSLRPQQETDDDFDVEGVAKLMENV